MSLEIYKALAAALIFIVSLIAVIYPVKTRSRPTHNKTLELGDAFASGIFLGAALFHMLPDANSLFSTLLPAIHYPLAELFCACGFLLLLFLERLSQYSAVQPEKTERGHNHTLPYMLAIILIIHALIEGAAVGVNTSFATATVIFAAIIAHKGSESFALAVILNRSQLSLTAVIITIVFFAFMTPLGIGLGTTLTTVIQTQTGSLITAGFNAFAAGTFLYMSTLHHINHHHRYDEAEGLLEFLVLLLGLIIMGIIAGWA